VFKLRSRFRYVFSLNQGWNEQYAAVAYVYRLREDDRLRG